MNIVKMEIESSNEAKTTGRDEVSYSMIDLRTNIFNNGIIFYIISES